VDESRSPTPPPPLTEEQEHHLTQILPPMSLLEDQTDVSSMRLAIPHDVAERALQYRAPSIAASGTSRSSIDVDVGRALTPPMFSILIVGEHKYSRMATAHHIRVTLPPSIPSQITEVSEYTECHNLIAGEDPVVFTHIVINLPEASEIIELISQVLRSSMHALTTVIVLTNPMQRTAIMEGCGSSSKKLETRVQFIYKPIKPSRFAIIFDPTQERDASTDRYRDTAQQVADNQKRVFSEMEKEVGGKGHQILLVEDNNVNQKVLLRFLHKAGLSVETAGDGVECVEKVLAAGSGRYGLILCDLHMPRKDGFQACSEIRQWEKENGYPAVPIVALSANVMSDVAERCVTAGFSRYVTKPVDFKALGQTIKELLADKPSNVRHTSGGNLDGISPGSSPLPEVKEDRDAERKAEAEKDTKV
jgi:CheY-like chemotaxis protein